MKPEQKIITFSNQLLLLLLKRACRLEEEKSKIIREFDIQGCSQELMDPRKAHGIDF